MVRQKEHTQRVTCLCKSYVCNKRFTLAKNLARHKRRHTGEKPGLINGMFVIKDSRKQTMWSDIKEHTQRVTYSCKSFVCNERFTQASNLARHKRRHTGEKPYECNVCNKRFTRANNMVRHKKTHTGEKPYECDVYDNKFPSCSNLLKHEAKDDKKTSILTLRSNQKEGNQWVSLTWAVL